MPGRVTRTYACGGTVASGSQTPDPGVVGIRHIGLPPLTEAVSRWRGECWFRIGIWDRTKGKGASTLGPPEGPVTGDPGLGYRARLPTLWSIH